MDLREIFSGFRKHLFISPHWKTQHEPLNVQQSTTKLIKHNQNLNKSVSSQSSIKRYYYSNNNFFSLVNESIPLFGVHAERELSRYHVHCWFPLPTSETDWLPTVWISVDCEEPSLPCGKILQPSDCRQPAKHDNSYGKRQNGFEIS